MFVQIVQNCSKESLLPIIQGKILGGYDHYRIYHSKKEFSRGKTRSEASSPFGSFTKRRLAKCNGLITDSTFVSRLKKQSFNLIIDTKIFTNSC